MDQIFFSTHATGSKASCIASLQSVRQQLGLTMDDLLSRLLMESCDVSAPKALCMAARLCSGSIRLLLIPNKRFTPILLLDRKEIRGLLRSQ
jgi:hypothetical protein